MSDLQAREGAHFLKPGELFIAASPQLVTTLLGSCVAVTLFAPAVRLGGICHAVLPACGNDQCRHCPEQFRHVDCAVHGMLAALGQQGIRPEELEAKIFGGAAMFSMAAGSERQSVGQQNILKAEEVLRRLGIRVMARDVGGIQGRKLYFVTSTGDVYVKRLAGGAERLALSAMGVGP